VRPLLIAFSLLVIRQTIVPLWHTASIQLGWNTRCFANASLSTAFVPSANGTASEHEHPSSDSSGELTSLSVELDFLSIRFEIYRFYVFPQLLNCHHFHFSNKNKKTIEERTFREKRFFFTSSIPLNADVDKKLFEIKQAVG
jgi:hypothetical protein